MGEFMLEQVHPEYNFSDLFRGFRLRRDVTLKQVAEYLGLHENTVKRWNQGVSRPRYEEDVSRLKDLLELDPAEANRLLTSAGFTPRFSVPHSHHNSLLPVQKLYRDDDFIGRSNLKQQLLEKVMPGRVITVCGPAGAGKTSLVAEVLHDLETQGELLKRFSDGVIVVELYVATDTVSVLSHIVGSLGESIGDWPKWTARRVLAGRKLLLILDGAEVATNLSAILEVVGHSGVIITSRNRHDSPDGTWIDVGTLSTTEGVALLKQRIGSPIENDAALKEIHKLAGGLPLALSLAGKYLSRHPIFEDFIEWLREEPINTLSFGLHSKDSIERLLARSLSQLSPEIQEIVYIFGLLAYRPVPVEWMTTLVKQPLMRVRRHLNTLVDYHLLVSENNQYRTTHVLIYHYLRKHVAIRATTIVDLIQSLGEADLTAGDSSAGSRSEHMLAVALWLREQEAWPDLMTLYKPTLNLAKQGRDHTVSSLLEVVFEAANVVGEKPASCEVGILLGEERRDMGSLKEAVHLFEQCISLAKSVTDMRLEAKARQRLATVFAMLGQMDEAQSLFGQALTAYQSLNDTLGEGVVLGNLGHFSNLIGRYDLSKDYFKRTLALSQQSRDRSNEARWLSGLAESHYRLGETGEAIARYESALALCRQLNLKHAEAICLDGLGMGYKQLGNIDSAINYHKQSMALAEEIGNQFGVIASLGNIGSAYLDILQLPEKAIEFFEKALLINKQVGHGHAEAILIGNLGEAYLALGNLVAAERFLLKAINLRDSVKDLRHKANLTGSLGEVYRRQGKTDKAKKHYQRAVNQCREIGEQRGIAMHLAYLGRLAHEQQDATSAVTLLEEALELFEGIGDNFEIARWSFELAQIHRRNGQMEQVKIILDRSAEVCPPSADRLQQKIRQAQLQS